MLPSVNALRVKLKPATGRNPDCLANPRAQRSSQPKFQVLLSDDGHDLNDIVIDPVVNAVAPEHAASVSGADVLYGRVSARLFGDVLKALIQILNVIVGGVQAPFVEAVESYAFKVVFSIWRKPKVCHPVELSL